MAENSKIEWTDSTINFWWGCDKVHGGCANCYAEAWSKRYGLKLWGPGSVRKRIKGAIPLAHKLNAAAQKAGVRHKVFSNSMSDLFEEFNGKCVDEKANRICDGLDGFRREAFACIDEAPWLDWMLLTKRPENIRGMWCRCPCEGDYCTDPYCDWKNRHNVWLGTSCSLQNHADRQIPNLIHCRDLCAVLFLSAEPLLGPIDLRRITQPGGNNGQFGPFNAFNFGLDWVIVGGESGHGARPCDVAWIRSLRDQCQSAGVPVFIKQLGADCQIKAGSENWDWPASARFINGTALVNLRDRKGGDWSEWPEDLRVREFPSPQSIG